MDTVFPFQGYENVLRLTVVMVVQPYKYTKKNSELYTALNRYILWYVK